jgi:hypothetical protein
MNVQKITALITRPNDTTAYTAQDVVSDGSGTRFSFTNPQGGYGIGGLIESATIVHSVAPATPPDLELWLFDTDIAAIADNAAFGPSDAEAAGCIGIVAFATASFKKSANNEVCVQNNLGIAFQGPTVYGVLVIRNAITPTALETFRVSLEVIR